MPILTFSPANDSIAVEISCNSCAPPVPDALLTVKRSASSIVITAIACEVRAASAAMQPDSLMLPVSLRKLSA